MNPQGIAVSRGLDHRDVCPVRNITWGHRDRFRSRELSQNLRKLSQAMQGVLLQPERLFQWYEISFGFAMGVICVHLAS